MKTNFQNIAKSFSCMLSVFVVAFYSIFSLSIPVHASSIDSLDSDIMAWLDDTAYSIATSNLPSNAKTGFDVARGGLKVLNSKFFPDTYQMSSMTILDCTYTSGLDSMVHHAYLTLPAPGNIQANYENSVPLFYSDEFDVSFYIGDFRYYVNSITFNYAQGNNNLPFAIYLGVNASNYSDPVGFYISDSYEYLSNSPISFSHTEAVSVTLGWTYSDTPPVLNRGLNSTSGQAHTYWYGMFSFSEWHNATSGTYWLPDITFGDYYADPIDYINNTLLPDLFIQYPVLEDYVQPFEEQEETTVPSGVIIIDPFTLPPEWVESDVVELNTECYTIDYDGLLDEPIDDINYPLNPGNAIQRGGNLLTFGIQFFKDGGIFYIICTLLVLGLFLRFLDI